MRALAVMPRSGRSRGSSSQAAGAWLEADRRGGRLRPCRHRFAIGECLDGPARVALIADLAPGACGPLLGPVDQLLGRRLHLGPAVGGFVLAAEPLALWPLAAAVCLAAGAGAVALERRSHASSG